MNAGQVITASVADIITNYSFKDILRKLAREKQTGVAPPSYDDNYLGKLSSGPAGTQCQVEPSRGLEEVREQALHPQCPDGQRV